MNGITPSAHFPRLVVVAVQDAGLRPALEFMLGLEGYRVQAVESGEALLAVPLPNRGACLVVDQDLPGLSGLETIAALRRRGLDLPVVLLAAGGPAWLRSLAPQSRVHLIEKPLQGELLLRAISAALP